MASGASIDQMTNVALRSLHDVAVPQPVAWLPQTWGWAVLFIVAVAALGTYAWSRWRRYRKNAYRREALRLVDRIADNVEGTGLQRRQMEELAEIVKRTALATWQRERVAGLAGADWNAFLGASFDGSENSALKSLLDDLEYRKDGTPEQVSPMAAGDAIAGARRWIEGHHV
ncbi:DUF4381 family protein [Rhizobium lusitanum]|uniref:DUF4381 family protein n=2 Tax=Rhizobium lusitanum TaxID=293958 RepID=A0A6L9U8Q7_9HYPH|nr:DUF4381 family protein [Rhizobium lusitanum]